VKIQSCEECRQLETLICKCVTRLHELTSSANELSRQRAGELFDDAYSRTHTLTELRTKYREVVARLQALREVHELHARSHLEPENRAPRKSFEE
jgi:hypothetical protein